MAKKADVIGEIDVANEANVAKEANVIDEIADKPGDADEAKANEANEAEADEAGAEANETIVTKEIKANMINEEAIVIDKVIAVDEGILDNAANEAIVVDAAKYAIIADNADGAVLYSLTKYSATAIFAEVKGYVVITAPDNQLGQRSLCSLRSKNWYHLDNQLEVVVAKGLV